MSSTNGDGTEPTRQVEVSPTGEVREVEQDQAGRASGDAGDGIGELVPPVDDAVRAGGRGADAVAGASGGNAGAALDRVVSGVAAVGAIGEWLLAGGRERQDVPSEFGQFQGQGHGLTRAV